MITLLFLFTVSLAGIFSCSKEVQSQPNFIFKKGPNMETAAEFSGQKISYDELNKGIENDLYEAKMKVFEIQMNRLRSMVLEKLMEADDRKKGLTNDEYLERYIASGLSISKPEIEAFIKERGIPKQHINDAMKKKVEQFLLQQKKREAIEKWVGSKTAKKPVAVFLNRPERPVYDVSAGSSPFKGGSRAKVTVVEFSDFQCPFCKKGASLLREITKKYGDKVKIAFKQYPLPFHQQASKAAEASLCANELGGAKSFWKYHDKLFSEQGKLAVADLIAHGVAQGLNPEKFKKCLDSGRHAGTVKKEMDEGKAVGVKSTPTFFVNGKMVSGAQPLSVFSEIIDEELKK